MLYLRPRNEVGTAIEKQSLMQLFNLDKRCPFVQFTQPRLRDHAGHVWCWRESHVAKQGAVGREETCVLQIRETDGWMGWSDKVSGWWRWRAIRGGRERREGREVVFARRRRRSKTWKSSRIRSNEHASRERTPFLPQRLCLCNDNVRTQLIVHI